MHAADLRPPEADDMISTRINGALATPEAGGTSESGGMTTMGWGSAEWRAWWWALGAAALVLAVAYAPNLGELGRVWRDDDNYQHGFLVVPIALFILWRRLVEIPWAEPLEVASTPWWGWGLLAVILAVRALAYEWSFQWVETATILPAVACLAWAFGGRPLLFRAWPAILFLVFMLPLPTSVNGMIALPLQRVAATGSYILLQLSGFWVIQEGNVLKLTTPFGMRSLDVALACSGLKMLMTLAATVTATIMLLPLPRWKRLVLLASAVPIALISNISRIVTTGWCYYYIEGERGTHWAHDISGWMMMPLALIMVGLELKILSWLVPEMTEAEEDDRKAILPLLTDKGPGAKKPREPEI
jgi:exosortase